MMVKINQLLNQLILNDEWVRFHGDSEFQNKNGEWMLGAWSFLAIIEEVPEDAIILNPDDEIDENLVYEDLLFCIRNAKGHICVVQFHYRRD